MAQQVKAKAKVNDKSLSSRETILAFKKDVYTDLGPIVNAFRAYWYHTTSDTNNHKTRDLKIEKKMLAYLVSMIQNIPIPEANSLLIHQSAEIITVFISKDDGTLLNDEEQIKKFCDLVFEREGKVLCGLLYAENNHVPIFYSTEERQTMFLNIIRWNSGSYGMATKMNVFCRQGTLFCVICKTSYRNKGSHPNRCWQKCNSCFESGPEYPCQQELADGTWIKCDQCNLDFKSVRCHQNHLKTACKRQKRCKLCHATYQLGHGEMNHICGNKYCYQCHQHHPPNDRARGQHYCYIRKAKIHPDDFLRVLYVFYDIETIQKVIKAIPRKRVNSESEPYAHDKRPRIENTFEDGEAPSCSHHSEDSGVTHLTNFDQSEAPSCSHHSEDSGVTHLTNLEHACPELGEPSLAFMGAQHENADENGIVQHAVNSEAGKTLRDRIIAKHRGKSNSQHVANLMHSLIRCSDCIEDTDENRYCTYCHRQSTTFTSIPEHLLPSTSDENIVFDDDVTGAFMKYLLTLSQSSNYSSVYLYAHNASRFDSHLVLKAFTDRNYTTSQFIQKGNSIIEATISSGQGIEKALHFRDTYRIIPVALRAFQKTFDLGELLHKFDFPHFYNLEKFYDKILDTLPDKEYYGYSNMKKAEKAKFDLKYDAECKKMEENGSKYSLPLELKKYCIQDVNVLYKGFVEFRKIKNEVVREKVDEFDAKKLRGDRSKTFYDILLKGTTVAALTLYVYRLRFLNTDKVALIPETGYTDKTNQSKIATGYLEWIMKKNAHFIQHAHNIGEHKIGKISVDGYNIDTKEIIQVHGCLWHGCPSCYLDRTKVLLDGKTAGDFYASTVEKAKRLDKAIEDDPNYSKVVVVWECQIRKEMNKDKDMFDFINATEDVSNIDLRKTLSGGRTGPLRMQAKYTPGEHKISYYDICSLYP
uniref:DNA-directed DNA polymerase n=1 Tax=Panagrolaimus superbus TaxID=310955 RepID=A0A914Z4U1_9BILA